ncbi:NAD(P)/FAD-dependent oxidoreductase [Halobium salinum]|uniref:NAD(P)/FAD-dependent oxidoreductase n=1 Tax=Halobium salinum TaxID=1364940 RepID=A0ABD5PGU9_9EURY|nr:NAD(P)/FAD-dependent oxidoreductase [Halobium salinum]
MRRNPSYEVAVVGGGPAGATAALYTTRLGHRTALVDGVGGRHESASHVHNLIGLSEATSGAELSAEAKAQLDEYGGDVYEERVETVERPGDAVPERFELRGDRSTVRADAVVLATGFSDQDPGVPGIERFTGRGLHYCLHCDAYGLADGPVFVLGHDDHAAHVALTMLNFTADVDLFPDGADPTWSDEVAAQLDAYSVTVDDRIVDGAYATDEAADDRDELWLGGLTFADGERRDYLGGFAMYGRTFESGLANDLGCDLNADGSVAADEVGRTSVDGVYAAGDLTHGQNQTPIAIGDGARTGIAVHKALRAFPRPAEGTEGAERGDGRRDAGHGSAPDAPAVPDDLRATMRRVRDRGADSGFGPDE